MPTIFHLIRHAEYVLTGQVLGGRATGHALTEAGHAQAHALARAINGRNVGAIIASPMERARETALPIAACFDLEIEIDPAWNEIDFGEWTGLAFELLDDLPEWRRWNRLRSLSTPPGGESMVDAQARALAAVHALGARYPAHDVVVVSHGDIIKSVLAHMLGMPLDLMLRLEISPGSLSQLTLFDDHVRVDLVNHLPAAREDA